MPCGIVTVRLCWKYYNIFETTLEVPRLCVSFSSENMGGATVGGGGHYPPPSKGGGQEVKIYRIYNIIIRNVSPGSAETLVRRDAMTNHLLIAYSLGLATFSPNITRIV